MTEEATPTGSDPSPLVVGVWGPPEPARRRARPGVRHIVGGILGALLLPLIPGAIVVSQAISQAGLNGGSSAEIAGDVTAVLSSNGPLLVASLLLTWVALILPVLLAGRLQQGGWRALVHWQFAWKRDIPIAVCFAVGMQLLSLLASFLLGHFGIDTSELGNTDMLTSAGPGWAVFMALGAVIGAPLAEELFFRGLTLRVLARKIGMPAAIVLSSVLFGMLHVQGDLASSVYTITATGLLGLGLALLVVKTGRLGTSVLSHALFNGISVVLVFALPMLPGN